MVSIHDTAGCFKAQSGQLSKVGDETQKSGGELNRTYAKQTLALLRSPRRTNVLSSAPRLASAILHKPY